MSKGFASNYRTALLAAGIFICFAGVGVRLFYLHVIDRDKLVKFVSSYVGDAKGPGIVERQLKHCEPATADSFSSADQQKIASFIIAAAALYIPDDAKKEEFKTKLASL